MIHVAGSAESFGRFSREMAAAYENQRRGLVWRGLCANPDAYWATLTLGQMTAVSQQCWLFLANLNALRPEAKC